MPPHIDGGVMKMKKKKNQLSSSDVVVGEDGENFRGLAHGCSDLLLTNFSLKTFLHSNPLFCNMQIMKIPTHNYAEHSMAA